MPVTLDVCLGERRVGTLTNLPGDYNLFAFDEDYLDDPARPVLSQSFIGQSGAPLRVIPRTHRVAPPFFANLLPEEGTVLRAIVARQFEINRTRDFPFLRVLGLDLPGAVVLRGAQGDDREDELAPPHLVTPAERPWRFSLAGVQPKFSASLVADRLTIPLRGVGGSWIAKLPTNAWRRLPENEFTIMSLAKTIGLDVPRIGLFPLDSIEGLPPELPALRADEPHVVYAIERFDRLTGGGRVHDEDFNQIADQPPSQKYESKSTHWIANVVATLCPSSDVDEFVRRLVFGVCVGNNDMHLKNWAVRYPDGRNARLAPYYDGVCTRVYFPAAELALAIAGEKSFERIDRSVLKTFAARAEISAKRALLVAAETVTAIRDAWPRFKETIDDQRLVQTLERQFSAVPLMSGR
jgi:serine/threonine-protein kinase HipA